MHKGNMELIMKRFTRIIFLTVPVYCFAIGWVMASQTDQGASSNSNPKSAAELVNEGMAAYQKKDYAQSARLLQEAVSKGANDVDTLYNTACSLALAGDSQRALQFLDKAIRAGFRNTNHLNSDADLNSLHNDASWKKIVAACAEQQARWIKNHSDPEKTRFVTADIDRFWKAYDKAMAAPAEGRVAILQRDYIDPGTVGLKDFAASGRLSAKTLAKTIETRPRFFKAIRPLTIEVQSHRAATVASFRKFKELYPEAIFPESYFVIGQLQSGGTSSANGLLMGSEMFTRAPGTPADELTEWQKGALMPPNDIPPLVAHESVHFQQKYLSQTGLLCACLKEGSADFLGKLTSGRLIARMEETHRWANARERELWEEFQKGMEGEDTSHWLYGNSGGNGRPVDLGYWMGYKIAEAYFNNSADKMRAVRDILVVNDCKKFLRDSRYSEKFSPSESAQK
jgi:tetratricopeptide (TPR) repeat protein